MIKSKLLNLSNICLKQLLTLFFILYLVPSFADINTGKCGTNINYRLDTSTGILEITGTGKMDDYSGYKNSVFYQNSSYIKEVHFSEGITHVGSYSLSFICAKSINLPQSLLSVGKGAFYLSDLEEVVIPHKVTTIGEEAFESYDNGMCPLKKIEIGESVKEIGKYAFGIYSDSLKVLISHVADPFAYGWSFKNNSTEAVLFVPEGCSSKYENLSGWSKFCIYEEKSSNCDFAVDGIYYDFVSLNDLTCKVVGYDVYKFIDNKENNLTIDEYVEYNNKQIQVIELKNEALSQFPFLKSVSISNSVETIGANVFNGCRFLAKVEIPIGIQKMNSSFAGLPVEKVIFTGDGQMVPNWFAGCDKLADIVFESHTIKSIVDGAFDGCSALNEFNIAKSINVIGNDVFKGCTSLKKLIIESGSKELELGNTGLKGAFVSCPIEELYIGRNIVFDKAPFESCAKIKYLEFGDSVSVINDKSLANLSNIEELRIGGGIKEIPAFPKANNLQNIYIGSGVNRIPNFSHLTTTKKIVLQSYKPQDVQTDFTNSMYINCEIKIPNGTLNAYKNHPIWGEFWSLSEYTVSSEPQVILAKDMEIGLNDTVYIDYQIKPFDANNNIIIEWDNPGVVEVLDGNRIIAKAIGETDAMIYSYNRKLSTSCRIKVSPIKVESVSINNTNLVLRQDSTILLTATIAPQNATNKDFYWKSDNDAVASVDNYGIVRGREVGFANIVVISKDNVNITDTCQVQVVVPYDLGDVNDDGSINIADVNGVVNFILDTNTENLIYRAADINKDNRILVDDLSDIITMVMEGATPNQARAKVQSRIANTYNNYMVMNPGDGTYGVAVSLAEKDNDFSGLQFDVTLPEGYVMDDATVANDDTQLVWNQLQNSDVRIMIYSPSNSAICSGENIVSLKLAKLTGYSNDILVIHSAVATDNKANAYSIGGSNYQLSETTEIPSIDVPMNNNHTIYNLLGQKVENIKSKGIYIYNGKKFINK